MNKTIEEQKNEIAQLQLKVEERSDRRKEVETRTVAELKQKLRESESHLNQCQLQNNTLESALKSRDIEISNLQKNYLSEKNIRQEI